MINSMTGFGSSEMIQNDFEIYCEIKSINHRFNEISIKSNDLPNDLEDYIKKSISKDNKRGKFEVRLRFKMPQKTYYSIDTELLKKFKTSLEKSTIDSSEIKFNDIKNVPGIFQINTSINLNKKHIKDVFNNALEDLHSSKVSEGKKICKVLLKKINYIKTTISKINKASQKNIHKRKRKYQQKVLEIIDTLDKKRLEQEIVLLALKHDVSEEIDRINFHCESLVKEINQKKTSGKKIDFILQELFREANTLTVKLDESNLKSYGLEIKLSIEEMREQIQNVE
ncbi:MAG: YicC/YloC family endoribonuclease [Gammaproteobacteria bacterium]|jgi:uncharacterized protein (TIGR00255 family)